MNNSIIQRLNSCDGNYLSLNGLRIQDQDLEYIINKLQGTQVTSLNLSDNIITSKGIKILFEGLKNNNLNINNLNLSGNIIRDEGAEALADGLIGTDVRVLNLDSCAIEEKGANDICRVLQLSNTDVKVHEIDLRGNKIGAIAATNIVESRNISYFFDKDCQPIRGQDNIIQEPINDAIMNNATTRDNNTQKTKLELVSKNIKGQESIKNIIKYVKERDIQSLDLALNILGDAEVKVLMEGLKDTQVKSLNLSFNIIENDGAKAIADNLNCTNIESLYLRSNRIADEGALNIAKASNNSVLVLIDMYKNCNITEPGLEKAIEALDKSVLIHLECDLYNKNLHLTELLQKKISDNRENFIDLQLELKSWYALADKTDEELKTHIINLLAKDKITDSIIKLMLSNLQNPHIIKHIIDVCKLPKDDATKYIEETIPQKFAEHFAIKTYKEKYNTESEFLNAVHHDVNILRKFKDLGLDNVVKALLLHRPMYMIDNNNEILHPYVYKLLFANNEDPLYHKDLEPNKREKIVNYFKSSLDQSVVAKVLNYIKSFFYNDMKQEYIQDAQEYIQDAQEVVQILESPEAIADDCSNINSYQEDDLGIALIDLRDLLPHDIMGD